jgi:hypothetical protein
MGGQPPPVPLGLCVTITADHPFRGDARVMRTTARCSNVVQCGGAPNADSSRQTGDATMDCALSTQTQVGRTKGKEFSMGFRRRVRRRALVVGVAGGAAMAHHEATKAGEQQQADDQAPADDGQDQGPADDGQDQTQYAPPAADPADEIEHLAQLHASGALSDDEFTAAKAKILGT